MILFWGLLISAVDLEQYSVNVGLREHAMISLNSFSLKAFFTTENVTLMPVIIYCAVSEKAISFLQNFAES